MLSSRQAGTRRVLRAFSTSAPTPFKAYIGSAPIQYPDTVTLTPTDTAVYVKGPLGETSVPRMPFVRLEEQTPRTLLVSVEDAGIREQRNMWGTTRTLIANAVTGMTVGFTLPVYLVGVGYRTALEVDPKGKREGWSGQRFNMKLGFSHTVYVPIPDYIKAEVPSPTKMVLFCLSKEKLGQFAADVRKIRPPEPYKGKGIIVGNEIIRMKRMKKK
ncbi:ribosomal protein L6 [Epithele typhae]|uniref:ribosomal protein L6 n=1 Tax=Epithele typhae TaxID=378194 RepID=UPI002008728A|nr:ribosomal protein L6 [Epithele typhae]KAH9933103.1 ribosomal protein L6 [Epithele typhae]